MYSTLIGTQELMEHVGHPDWAIVDCRFSLADTELGYRQYRQGHIPGAIYAHLDRDLSGKIFPGETGRHPLPELSKISDTFSDWGIDGRTQVVAYDDSGGMIAARLWWMLHWLGHKTAAVLDGGWDSWIHEGRPVDQRSGSRPRRTFAADPDPTMLRTAEEILAQLELSTLTLVDARSPERYTGKEEPIDARAGRIPSAKNLPHAQLVGADGKFLPPDVLKTQFEGLLAGSNPKDAIFYCGSGVSAARNLLAMAIAGLPMGKLYAGSWSHWITDPDRPVVKD